MGMLTSDFLTVGEVATLLRCSKHTVLRYIRSERLKGYKDGGRHLIRKAHLEAYFANMTPSATKKEPV